MPPLEIKKVTNFLKMSDSPEYRDDITDKNAGINTSDNPSMAGMSEDELYKDAYECVLQNQKASASLLQRRLKVGYARAAKTPRYFRGKWSCRTSKRSQTT